MRQDRTSRFRLPPRPALGPRLQGAPGPGLPALRSRVGFRASAWTAVRAVWPAGQEVALLDRQRASEGQTGSPRGPEERLASEQVPPLLSSHPDPCRPATDLALGGPGAAPRAQVQAQPTPLDPTPELSAPALPACSAPEPSLPHLRKGSRDPQIQRRDTHAVREASGLCAQSRSDRWGRSEATQGRRQGWRCSLRPGDWAARCLPANRPSAQGGRAGRSQCHQGSGTVGGTRGWGGRVEERRQRMPRSRTIPRGPG